MINIPTKVTIKKAILNKNETQILSWNNDDSINLWDIDSGELIHELKDEGIIDIIFSKDGTQIISYSKKASKIWKIKHSRRIEILESPFFIRIHEDKNVFFSSNDDETLVIKDIDTGKVINTFPHQIENRNFIVNKDITKLLLFGDGNNTELWDIQKNKLLKKFDHHDFVAGAIFNQDETKVLSWSNDIINLWSIEGGQLVHSFENDLYLSKVFFNKNETKIVAFIYAIDPHLITLDINSRKLSKKLIKNIKVDGPQWNKDKTKWNKDKTKILFWNYNNDYIQILDVKENKVFRRFKFKKVKGAIFSDDENKILCWNYDGTLRIIDINSGKVMLRLQHIGINGALLSKSGTRILSWGNNRTLKLWNYDSIELLFTSFFSSYPITGATFNKDETKIYFWNNIELGTSMLYPRTHIDKNIYPLKTEVETGTYLTSSGEVKALTKKEWEAKKKEYEKILAEAKD